MRLALILMLLVAQWTLTACDNSKGLSTLRVPDLPETVDDDCAPREDGVLDCCPEPDEFFGSGDWLIIAGELGVALIECGEEKGQAVAAYRGVQDVLDE